MFSWLHAALTISQAIARIPCKIIEIGTPLRWHHHFAEIAVNLGGGFLVDFFQILLISPYYILWVPELSHGWQVGKYLPDEMPSLPGKSKRPEAKFVGGSQRDPNEKQQGFQGFHKTWIEPLEVI